MTPTLLNAASAYRSVGLQTKAAAQDPYQLVALMYETVLEDINKARGGIQQNSLLVKIKHIDRAIRIIQEGLRTSLDLEQGGELAGNLAALYDYAVTKLAQANAKNDEAMLIEVAGLIEPLLDAWKKIGPNEGAQAVTNVASVTPAGLTVGSSISRPNTTGAQRPVGAYARVAAYGNTAMAAGA